MAAMTKMRVGLIGTGDIARPYITDLVNYPDDIEVVGVTDLDSARAEAFAEKYKTRAFATSDELLKEIDIAVNLTSHHAHKEVTTKCLRAGKHVHSEKPLALSYEDARELVELAQECGVRLACSPFTLMGEAQQTAWKWIRDGKLGKVRVVYAEVNWGRIETWHPAPIPFYEVGAVFDVGVYPMTILTAIFGPAKRLQASGKVVWPERVSKDGKSFHVETPDWTVAMIEMADGTVVRLSSNFYVTQKTKQTGIEFHGDLASLYLDRWHNFDANIEFAPWGEPFQAIPYVREPFKGLPWGRAIHDMVKAIRENRPHRFTGEHAAHVTEIIAGVMKSIETNQPVELNSTFNPPAPMEWAE
jgi:predicted dehydrogenase